MLTINHRYSIDSDKNQFILIEQYEGKSQEGRPARTQHRHTYHATLGQALHKIVERESGHASDVQELLGILERVGAEISQALEQHGGLHERTPLRSN